MPRPPNLGGHTFYPVRWDTPKLKRWDEHTHDISANFCPPLYFLRWDTNIKKSDTYVKIFYFLRAVVSIIRALGISWFRNKISILNQIPLKTSDNLNVMWRFFRMFLSFSIAHFRHIYYSKFFMFQLFFDGKSKQFTLSKDSVMFSTMWQLRSICW